jgi:hypothetical protein
MDASITPRVRLRRDIKLTKQCVKRYRHIVEKLRAAVTTGARETVVRSLAFGPEDCALCAHYNGPDSRPETACRGCPVAYKAGQRFCHGTPYYRGARSLSLLRWYLEDECGDSRKYDQFVAQCEKEAVFLESVLKDLEQKL